MENLPQKKKQGLPARLTPMQRQFADILVFNEGHKYAYECAKEAGYEGDNAILRKKASELQNPKYYPLVVKHIGELPRLERRTLFLIILIQELYQEGFHLFAKQFWKGLYIRVSCL